MGVQYNEDKWWNVLISLTPTSVGANTTVEQNFTLAGLRTTDFIEINKPSHQTGLSIGNVRCSAANTLTIQYVNTSGSPITPTAETYSVWVERPEKTYTSIATL